MEIEMQFRFCSYRRDCRYGTSLFWALNHKQNIKAISFRVDINYYGCTSNDLHQRKISLARPDQNFFITGASKNTQTDEKFIITRASKNTQQSTEVSFDGPKKKKGSIVGAVALIIGTSIGSGILELPKKTSPAGFIPSSVSMILCWGFLLIEALLLAEINVGLSRKKMKRESEELEVISIRTMAQETLGDWGGTLATVNYLFLGYTTMVVYTSKSGVIIHNLINIPSSISGFFFTALFTILVSVGGTRTTDQVNQWLTATMIGILIAIEVLAVLYGGWSGLDGSGNWGKVPATLPVIIFSLVYHDLSPVICAYLDGDLARIRTSLMIGSLVPLLALLVWDAVALGLSANADQVADPLDLLMRVRWSGVSAMVEAFSLLAVGTSLIGTLLGFSQFFLEQLNNLSSNFPPSTQTLKFEENTEPIRVSRDESRLIGLKKWWGINKLSFTAMAMAVAPALFISSTVPDAFSAATDIAGGYCMTMLYGVLPPAMAWAMNTRSSKNVGSDGDENSEEDDGAMELSRVKPALIGVGLFSCGIVIDQILEDLSVLHP